MECADEINDINYVFYYYYYCYCWGSGIEQKLTESNDYQRKHYE